MNTLRHLVATVSFTPAALLVLTLFASAAQHLAAGEAALTQWSFEHHGAEVPVAIWYPAEGESTTIEAGPFSLQAVSSGEMAQRRHALVIISHGTGGSNIAHHSIAHALASEGFMVAALTHPGDNFQDRSLIADARYFDERPRQVQALLRAITADKKLGALIDLKRVGAVGHSAGGYAVAVAIGADPDRQSLRQHCDEVGDDPSCKYRDPSFGVVAPSESIFVLPVDASPALQRGTPSIRSAVLLAPLGKPIDADSRIDASVPVLIITAEHDQILPDKYHLSRLQRVAPHAVSRVAKGAGHFSFIAPVNDAWRTELAEVADDPAGFDRTAFNKKLGKELSRWFIKTLEP